MYSAVLKPPPFEVNGIAVEVVAGAVGDGPGRSQIAEFGKVRPFLDVQFLDDFGNEEVQVGVALPVAVGDHIHGHPIHRDGHIRAVVGVKTA